MWSKTIDVRSAYSEVAREAEEIRSDAHETIPMMSPGDVVRQGDLYITRLDREPSGTRPTETRRLAEGSGPGAQHAVEGDCDVFRVNPRDAVETLRRIVRGVDLVPLIGPVIRARGPVTITHPEHGDRTLPGDSWYLVTYQRTWTALGSRPWYD